MKALEILEFNDIAEKAKEINVEITNSVKKKRESIKALKMPENNLTEEEAAREMEELHKEALKFLEEKQKKEKK